jgi:hypothetical protein
MRQFIEGIHNYCDRWCERCAFTTRCKSFEIEKKIKEAESKHGSIDRNDFWKIFDSVFGKTTDFQDDIDLDDNNKPYDFQEINYFSFEPETTVENLWKKVDDNKILESTKLYAIECCQWLDRYENAIVNSSENSFEKNSDRVVDSLEVIRWYSFFIYAKLHRALSRDQDECGDLPVDSDENGSAKIALIAISRSIVAWSIIRSVYQNDNNQTAGFIGQLISVRRVVEQIFPNATEFIRPGFDTV